MFLFQISCSVFIRNDEKVLKVDKCCSDNKKVTFWAHHALLLNA